MIPKDSTRLQPQRGLQPISRHHHFREDQVDPTDRVAALEMAVVRELTSTSVTDSGRDSSIAWELKHQAGVTQFGRVLASKRDLDVDLAAVGALLHDIYTIRTGSYEDHARRGGPIAVEMMETTGGFSSADMDIVLRIVTNHSDKDVASDDPWTEFGKDVDVLDCFLYPHSLDEYLLSKPLGKVKWYLARAKRVWIELGIPLQPGFGTLDDFDDDGWLSVATPLTVDDYQAIMCAAVDHPLMPPFAIGRTAAGSLVSLTATPIRPGALKGQTGNNVESIPTAPSAGDLLLVWPGIARYQFIGRSEAEEKRIAVGVLD